MHSFAGIDLGNLIPLALGLVREAAAKSGLSGADKEQWVIEQLENEVAALVSQALPMFRPFVRGALDFVVPIVIKSLWHALFGPAAGLP